MKQKDIALFAVVGIVSTVVSFFLSSILITPDKNKSQKAEVVGSITSEFNVPSKDSRYFNDKSNNPTKLIQIGDGANNTPFNGTR